MRTALLAFAVLTLFGCQCSGNGLIVQSEKDAGVSTLPGEEPFALSISPVDAQLETDGVTPAAANYKAVLSYTSGRLEDVSQKATFSIDNRELGTFTGPAFASGVVRGGKARVGAVFGTLQATTSLTLVVRRTVTDPKSMNVPQDPAGVFAGAAPGGPAPELVYPNDGVLVPPNLGKLELHFLPGAGNTLFELAFKSPLAEVRVYARCATPLNGGCVYEPDAAVWSALANTNRGGEAVTVTVRGTNDAGASVGASSAVRILFSKDDIQGGLYYWTTTAKAIMRFDFASPTQVTAEKFADSGTVGGGISCVGCHALSRDGRKMVIEAEGAFDGRVALMDVGKRSAMVPFPSPNRSFFSSWNPDATRYVGVDDRAADFNLRVFDGTTGQLTESIADTGSAARPANHPDWSADGNTIAYARVSRRGPRGESLQWATEGAIALVQKTPNGAWSAPITVAPWVSGKHRYYPALSPSNDFLVFNESICGSGDADIECDSDADPSAKLYAATLVAGAPLVELAKANAPGKADGPKVKLTNSFPKWSPFNFQRTGELGSRLQWLTFSSTRAYGLRQPGDLMWLWMVAVDPAKVAQGQDPSYAAFCLPFQDLSTSNHIAQWTTVVVPIIN